MNITDQLKEALNRSISVSKEKNAYAYLPEIIETLQAIEKHSLEGDMQKCKKLSAGLGRLVTEDFEFSESVNEGDALH